MDLRIDRTRNNIINAFITLRAKKPLEKITIKELSELAYINKATFYRHYEDIYALSESIENELVANCLDLIPEPDYLFQKDGIRLMTEAFLTQSELFNIVFSGSRQDIAVHKIHDCLLEKIFLKYPEYRNDLEKKVILTALIHGIFISYFTYKEEDFDTVIDSLSKLNSAFIK